MSGQTSAICILDFAIHCVTKVRATIASVQYHVYSKFIGYLLGDSDPKFMDEEWPLLWNFPRIKVVKGNAANRADLRAVQARSCKMVVILGAPGIRESRKNAKGHQALLDKEVIIATLNVRDMSFPEGRIGRKEKDIEMEDEEDYDDHLADLLRKLPDDHQMGSYVPVITELARSNNVRFLDLFDQNPPLTEPYMSHPFACGRAVASSIVDSLSISTFFHPVVFSIFNTLVFGQASSELDLVATEGAGMIGGPGISEPLRVKNEVIVRLVPVGVTGSPFVKHAESPYGLLVIDAILHLDYICLGVYRHMSLYDSKIAHSKRFVITNPPSDFILHPTDLVYCLVRIKSKKHDGFKPKKDGSHSENHKNDPGRDERPATAAMKKQKRESSEAEHQKSVAGMHSKPRTQSISSDSEEEKHGSSKDKSARKQQREKSPTGQQNSAADTNSRRKTQSVSSESEEEKSWSTKNEAKDTASDEAGRSEHRKTSSDKSISESSNASTSEPE